MAVIIRASVKKTIDTAAHAVILAIAVFVDIGVWFVEQMTDMDFEFLSVSYINLYSKLGVSSRKQLLAVYEASKADIPQKESYVN